MFNGLINTCSLQVTQYIREVGDSLNTVSSECGAKFPEALKSDSLQK